MFITVEGMEGSGKTSQIRHVAEFLRRRGISPLVTREPGGTPIGERIRAILLDPASRDLVPGAELLLYFADRIQHVETVIRPALDRGCTVLCDRYFDATLVYQGYARGLDTEMMHRMHRMLIGALAPDLTLLLDLPVEVGLSRAWQRIAIAHEDLESRFEEEAIDFHRKIRNGYLDLARREAERYRVIDASGSEAHVREAVAAVLTAELSRTGARPPEPPVPPKATMPRP